LERLLDGPCPPEAVARALGLPPALPQAAFGPPLALLLHQGSYPARLLTVHPEAWDVLTDEPCPAPGRDALLATIEADAQTHGLATALGRTRTREYLRLSRAEVEGAPLEAVGGDLSVLAEACIEACLRAHDLHTKVAVFGMGKLGGRELNFLSDIDLVFVHDDAVGSGPGGRKETVALHDALRKVVRLLEGEGPYRPLFRVDLRLRPFGARGALSLSSSATEAYYERHGRAWERQVWLRARHVGGNPALSESLLWFLRPFVFRRSVTPAIFEEIAALMHRARRRGRPGQRAVDLKLDEGGIRTVEFSVQALQLLHGGRDPSLRTTGTLAALDRAFAAGLLSDREHRELEHTYRMLRRVEHRLQLTDGAHTHTLPDTDAALELLARRLAAPHGPYPSDAAAFVESVTLARQVASSVAASIAPPLAPEGVDPRAPDRDAVLDLGAPSELRTSALQRLGVRDPAEVEALLQHLGSRTDGAWTSRGASKKGFEALLVACLDSADPDGAIARLVEFAARRPAHYEVWRFLSAPGRQGRDVVRLMAELFGTSAALSRGLVGLAQTGDTPEDDSVGLLMGASLAKLPDAHSLAADAERMAPDPRGFDATIRRFMEAQRVAIALFDLGQQPDALEVGHALSSLADLCVRQVLRDVVAEMAQRPATHGLRLAVFAAGKYGARGMDYGSDLDLIFVFDGPAGHREAIRVGQRLLARLTERHFGVRLYEVDMRLRPSGRQGLLVSSLEGFTRYHAKPLPAWERLALLPLRPIAEAVVEPRHQAPLAPPDAPGDAVSAAIPGALCDAVQAVVAGTLTQPVAADALARDVRALKRRIEAEIAREPKDGSVRNVKTGRGGSLELELLCGALSLQLASERGEAPKRGVIAQLDTLEGAGSLDAAEASALRAAYRFQRRLLNRLRMSPPAAGSDPDRFAQNSPRLRTLARRMGLTGRDDLLARHEASTQAVRTAFDQHLEG
jgi:glutamate-ammonia-ligase adenylyltransferase